MTIQCIINTCFSAAALTRKVHFQTARKNLFEKKSFKTNFYQKTCGWKTSSYEQSREDAKTPAMEWMRNFSCFHTRIGDLIELCGGWRSRSFRNTGNECWPLSRRVQHKSSLKNWNFRTFRSVCINFLLLLAQQGTQPRIDGGNCAMELENKLKRAGDWWKVRCARLCSKTNFGNIFRVPDTFCISTCSLIVNSSIVRN